MNNSIIFNVSQSGSLRWFDLLCSSDTCYILNPQSALTYDYLVVNKTLKICIDWILFDACPNDSLVLMHRPLSSITTSVTKFCYFGIK